MREDWNWGLSHVAELRADRVTATGEPRAGATRIVPDAAVTERYFVDESGGRRWCLPQRTSLCVETASLTQKSRATSS